MKVEVAVGVTICLVYLMSWSDAFHLRRRSYTLPWVKRDKEVLPYKRRPTETAFVIFSRFMTRQGHSPPLDDNVLADRLFKLFDMNENNYIERNEFKAMLMLLGVIHGSHS